LLEKKNFVVWTGHENMTLLDDLKMPSDASFSLQKQKLF